MNSQNAEVYEGILNAKGLRFGIVCSRFNEFFVEKLLDGALNCIRRHGGGDDQIMIVRVPGSYEIPFAVQKLAKSGKVDSIIALGVVIQGATSHAQYINAHVSSGLGEIGLSTGIPIIYGVVTTETLEQAIERCGTKSGNRGESAACAAIEMASLMKKLSQELSS